MAAEKKSEKPIIGWREWVTFPDLGIDSIKAKIDTGARTSSLHAFHVRIHERDGSTWVSFSVHPYQRNAKTTVSTEAELLEYRNVKSSTGHDSKRPVIVTHVELLGHRWPIELTLANRDSMGFRMLLGRQAVRERFLIDPGRSYNGGKRKNIVPKRRNTKNRKETR